MGVGGNYYIPPFCTMMKKCVNQAYICWCSWGEVGRPKVGEDTCMVLHSVTLQGWNKEEKKGQRSTLELFSVPHPARSAFSPLSPQALRAGQWSRHACTKEQRAPTCCFVALILIIILQMLCLLPASLMVLNPMHCYFTALHPVPGSCCEGSTANISPTFSLPPSSAGTW